METLFLPRSFHDLLSHPTAQYDRFLHHILAAITSEMPRDAQRTCICGCGEKVTIKTMRRHLRRATTTKYVQVAQEHNQSKQHQQQLRLEVLGLDRENTSTGPAASTSTISNDGELSAGRSPALTLDSEMAMEDFSGLETQDFVGSGSNGNTSDCGDELDLSDDSDEDPFEGRPDEFFWDDSDEEEGEIGDDFQAAEWLEGLSSQERLEEILNVDAAR
ncbi:hypothetical protein C8R45DRAFT_1094629 [Mycena sanguinolenta]|nr:hypothetical protein C8R45DRAFT_1094629 [Mycena sanguinolenta]